MKGNGWKLSVWIFMVIEIISLIILGMRIQHLHVLPTKYMVIYIVSAIVFQLLLFLMNRIPKVWKSIVSILGCILCSVAALYMFFALGKINDTIHKVTAEVQQVTTEMVVLGLKGTETIELDEDSSVFVGYMDKDVSELNDMQEKIADIVDHEVEYISFGDVFSMIDALYAAEVHMMIMDKAFMDVPAEVEGYEDFQEKVEEIYKMEIVEYIKPEKAEAEKEKNTEQFIVYISGIDKFGSVSAKSRSDVNILVAVNTKTKQIQMINTPRDYFVPLANSGGVKDKLTHAGIYGIDNSIGTMEMLYGVDIDYYVRMNFSGFEAIIDALGGIDVYSEYDFSVDATKHYYKGINHLNGIQALAFARERHAFSAGDVQRGRNQMEVVRATIEKAVSPEIIFNYSEILDEVSGMFQTNITSELIYSLVNMQIADMSAWEMNTYTVSGTGSKSKTYSMPHFNSYVMIPNTDEIQAARELLMQIFESEVEE